LAAAVVSVALLTLTGCFGDPSSPEHGNVAISVRDGRLVVVNCDALDAVTFYSLRVKREWLFVPAYENYVDLEGDGVDLPSEYEYVAGDSIEGMTLVDSSEREVTDASAIEISISGGTATPPEHVLREVPIPQGGLVPGEWVRYDGTTHLDACGL
jgi:hypothetical protein